jgi:hypothetical protein
MKEKTMKRLKYLGLAAAVFLALSITMFPFDREYAAYHHMGEIDSGIFLSVYPEAAGTKLDSCTLCHSGGSYTSGSPPKTTTLGSCQWCHYITNYGANETPENMLKTLNAYGKDYKNNGRSATSVTAIKNLDSDIDTYSNDTEIQAITYPGDPNDNPSKVPAPSIVFTREELEEMPQHSQFMLMNASKSDDAYTQYTGVPLENLVKSVMLDSATGITVFSPDGFATYHPFNPSANPNSYHVFGTYLAASFYYNEQADLAKNPTIGWCNYSAPSCTGRQNGDAIVNPGGLKMLLAIKRDGDYLTPGVLNPQNKLDGEGPFRVVPPQKNPGPPDQRSTAANAQDPSVWVWPYVPSADHNAGFSSRTVTMIRVEPLPPGTTDINTLEAGWPYVDENKIIVYGAITSNPLGKLNTDLGSLITTVQSAPSGAFKNKSSQDALANKIEAVKKQIDAGAYSGALEKLQNDVLQKSDGCVVIGAVDGNDWVIDSNLQNQIYSAIQAIIVLVYIVA